MKKISLKNLLLAILFFLCVPTAVTSETPKDNKAAKSIPGKADFSQKELTITKNPNFTTVIDIDSKKQKIGAYTFELHYDPTFLIPVKPEKGQEVEPTKEGFVTAFNTKKKGSIRITGFDITGKALMGGFTKVHWKAIKNGKTAISLKIITLVKGDYAALELDEKAKREVNLTISGVKEIMIEDKPEKKPIQKEKTPAAKSPASKK